MDRVCDLTPILIREFALKYLFYNKIATITELYEAILKNTDIDITNINVLNTLRNSEFFVEIRYTFFLREKVRKYIKG